MKVMRRLCKDVDRLVLLLGGRGPFRTILFCEHKGNNVICPSFGRGIAWLRLRSDGRAPPKELRWEPRLHLSVATVDSMVVWWYRYHTTPEAKFNMNSYRGGHEST